VTQPQRSDLSQDVINRAIERWRPRQSHFSNEMPWPLISMISLLCSY